MGKSKKKDATSDGEEATMEVSVTEDVTPEIDPYLHLSPIASPLADRKACKKIYSLVKATVQDNRKNVIFGHKLTVKHLRKGGKGIVILGGDTDPYDVISHIPVFCEEKEVPYIFTPSTRELGNAAGTRRICTCMCLLEGPDPKAYKKILKKISSKEED